MTRRIRFQEITSRVLCSAACLLFLFSLSLHIAEILVSEEEAVQIQSRTRRILALPVYLDDTVAVEKNALPKVYRKKAAAALRRTLLEEQEHILIVYEKPWEPSREDVIALAQTLYGECRGCSYIQKCAVCWCVFNRVDSPQFPNTLIGVVSAPSQLQGYSSTNPVWDSLYEIAYDCMVDWHYERNRVLDPDMCFFSGYGGINHFRNAWLTENATKFWEEQ